jgi:scyllo-inositol 2-dehydrogenase (NADP+)
MKTPIRVGIAGFGMSAKIMQIPFLLVNKNYKVVAILERRGQEAKTLLPNVTVVATIDELVNLPEVDLIIISTPNHTHFQYAEKALLAGKHVVVEKPFTDTINEAKILIELSRRLNLILTVYQNRRYVADFLTVKQIVREKLLGDVVEFVAHYDRYRPEVVHHSWKEDSRLGSGTLYNLGSHLIDQALVLFGKPKRLYADVRMQRPGVKADDYFDIQLDYGPFKAILKSCMLVREHGPRFVIHGTKGSFIKYGEDVQEALLNKGITPDTADWGSDPEEQWGLLHTEKNGEVIKDTYPSVKGGFGIFYENLYETLINNAPLQVTPEQGYNTIRIIELALKSSKKKAVVECDGLM